MRANTVPLQGPAILRQTAATLAARLGEIEQTAYEHGLDEIGHLAGVARLAAWDFVGIQEDELGAEPM